jgi:basic membrane protein A
MLRQTTKLVVIMLVLALLIPAATAALAAPHHQAVACEEDYNIQADDWLSKLADKFYGDILAYPAIFEATNAAAQSDDTYATIANADLIEVGWKLCIPSSEDAQALLGSEIAATTGAADLRVSMVLPGPIDEGGFMQAGYEGLVKIQDELGAEIAYKDRVKPTVEDLTTAIRELAQNNPDLIITHGSQTSAAAEAAAQEFPDIRFVVIQGNVTGPNLSSNATLLPQSAWLAGAAAGLLTETDVVGHISGLPTARSGQLGRAAFDDGLKTTNPEARFLTSFTGDQDDTEIAKAVAQAQIDEGADIIFTMLNAARPGVTEAAEANGVYQIGDVRDYTQDNPEVYIGSAINNVSIAVFRAGQDVATGNWQPSTVIRIGLEDPEAVRLALAPQVPPDVVARIDELAELIKSGEIEIPSEYTGEDFVPSLPLRVAMLIPGKIDDGGFMEAGYNGLLSIEQELGAEISYVDQVQPEPELLAAALRELAQQNPDLVIAHGGQNSKAAEEVAKEFPNVRFVVVQGNVTGDNLSSYEILQEQSAWLAGAAAGLLTDGNVVGHISGIRVTPGLKGRAAFADGLRTTNPEARFLTTFSGSQDDAELAKQVALAQVNEGADIIFTMLNAARTGAIEANKETGTFQMGNVRDWYEVEPEVFIASALANVSKAGLRAAQDVASGNWQPGTIVKIGLEDPDAVSLALAPTVPAEVIEQINVLAEKIKSGEIGVSIEYDGEEFAVEP